MSEVETKRVRAWNVRVGDELPWFDAKAKAEIAMVVRGVHVRELLDGTQYVAIDIVKRDAKRKQRYVWRTAKNSTVRVRRVK